MVEIIYSDLIIFPDNIAAVMSCLFSISYLESELAICKVFTKKAWNAVKSLFGFRFGFSHLNEVLCETKQ